MKEYDIWKDDSYQQIQQLLAAYQNINHNDSKRMQVLNTNLQTDPNFPNHPNSSILLKELLFQHNLNLYTEKTNYTALKYPPWKSLTAEEKNDILNITLGDPHRYDYGITMGLTTYYGVLLTVGIPGNGLTLLIILTNSYMRTAPNFFLLNIAVADLVTLIMGKIRFLNVDKIINKILQVQK